MRLRAHQLDLRLQLASAAEVRRRGYVARALCRELALVPAWQDGGEMRILTEARLGGRDEGEVFAMASRHPVGGFGKLERRTTRDGAVIWVLRGGNPWVATWLLDLERWAEATVDQWTEPQVGFLAAVPTRSTLYVHVLNTSDAVPETVGALAMLAATGFRTTPERPLSPDVAEIRPRPDPLVPEVLWYKARQVRTVPTRVDLETGAVTVTPSEDFTREVLVPMGLA